MNCLIQRIYIFEKTNKQTKTDVSSDVINGKDFNNPHSDHWYFCNINVQIIVLLNVVNVDHMNCIQCHFCRYHCIGKLWIKSEWYRKMLMTSVQVKPYLIKYSCSSHSSLKEFTSLIEVYVILCRSSVLWQKGRIGSCEYVRFDQWWLPMSMASLPSRVQFGNTFVLRDIQTLIIIFFVNLVVMLFCYMENKINLCLLFLEYGGRKCPGNERFILYTSYIVWRYSKLVIDFD